MSHSFPVLVGLSLRCDQRAPRLARRAIEGALETHPVLDDARLVASELVNDAVLNSGCEADDIIRVLARLDAGFLVISVHAPVSPSVPTPEPTAYDYETEGLSLHVVRHIADRWGAESPGDHGVWAALPFGTAG
jgi:hypothetical protein